MKLRYSPTSPYVRKISVTIIELGLEDDVTNVPTNVWDAECDIANDNPLGKVPTLVADDGKAIYDSPVIVEFLESLASADKNIRLIPPSGDMRWKVLRLQALADGVLDAAILKFLELRRSENERSAAWMKRQESVIERGYAALDREAASFADGGIDIGQISTACLLGWYEFRFPGFSWRGDCPSLSRWFDTFSTRPSMQKTGPKEP